MTLTKFFRLYAPEPGDSGSTAVDRGDTVAGDEDAPAAEVKDDPAVKELDATLEKEAEDKDTEDKDDPKAKKETRIPLARHESVLAKEREKRAEVERQLAQYQQGGQIADVNAEITALETSVLKLEKEYANLLTDGEVDKAAAIMSQIRKAERDMAESKSDMKIQAAEIRATERARYNTALERIESSFPTLNPDHGDYDEDAMSEVVELKEAYQLKGLTPTAALQKAVKLIVEPRTTRQEIATSTKPNVSDKDVAAERKKSAVGKTLDAATKTPPSLTKVGQDSDRMGGGKLDSKAVMQMSQKAFAKLSDETLAEMRGDNF